MLKFSNNLQWKHNPLLWKHGTYQFVRGKHIRLDYKLWCLCSSDESLIHAEPCCGSDTNIEETGLVQVPDVILGLIDKCKLPKQSTATFGNLLTSLHYSIRYVMTVFMDFKLFEKIDCKVHHRWTKREELMIKHQTGRTSW